MKRNTKNYKEIYIARETHPTIRYWSNATAAGLSLRTKQSA